MEDLLGAMVSGRSIYLIALFDRKDVIDINGQMRSRGDQRNKL